jgi:hypothetical protein
MPSNNSDLQELLAYIQATNPGALDQMMTGGVAPEQMGLQSEQAKRGAVLASTQTPQGLHVGGTYVASSPLEHLAAAIRQGQGLSLQKNASQAQQQALQQQKQGRLAYLQGISGQGQQAGSESAGEPVLGTPQLY